MVQLVLELALARDPRDRGIAGEPLHRRRRHRATTLELACRRARNAGQGVDAGADDQLRPWAGTIALAAGPLPAELDQRVVLALAVVARVVLAWLHKGLQRGANHGAAFGIEQAVDSHHAILRLTEMQIPPGMRPVGLVECAFAVDPMLEILGDANELARVMRLRRLQ